MKRRIRRTWQRRAASFGAALMALAGGGIAQALPQEGSIQSGSAEITSQDKSMVIDQKTDRVAIDWKGFDIARDEAVRFLQPGASSIALNRVTGGGASIIDGVLTANGNVFLVNPNGVLFGRGAQIDVGGLVASTAELQNDQLDAFAAGKSLDLQLAEGNRATIVNEATIKAEGGLVALHAASVENAGTIAADGGKIALASAKEINIAADSAGKLNFTVNGDLAKARTINRGILTADGGYILMTAKAAGDVMSSIVNNEGIIEATTARLNEKGQVVLDAGTGTATVSGRIDVSGTGAGESGGTLRVLGGETRVADTAELTARGRVDGGLIETSGDYLDIGENAGIDAAGETGKAGEWQLDPLEVVISADKPSGAATGVITKEGDKGVNGNWEDVNKTTWVSSKQINTLLNQNTSVTVEAVDKNKAASITVNSELKKTAGTGISTLKLQAQRNITVNKAITAEQGKLNVVLNADTDGDAIGAVLVNADIKTNGGSFTSGSGGTRVQKNGSRFGNPYQTAGTADPTQGTTGTYFGNGGASGDRLIETKGGDVNLYGDVAIGLNGGKLLINAGSEAGQKGNVNITGSVDSGNAYTVYSLDNASALDKAVAIAKKKISTWESDLEKYYETVLNTDEAKLEFTGRDKFPKTGRWINRHSDKSFAAVKNDAKAYATLQRYYLANTWTAAKAAAQGDTAGGAAVGDTYLATITTALENSLVSQGKEMPLFVGGRGSGTLTKEHNTPADAAYKDGYYWVTGPEGLAGGGRGTKFAEKDGSATSNYYVKWNDGKSELTGATEKEPNNSGPYVTVGFGVASDWDDVGQKEGTTAGFVQEKNLAHSALDIQNAKDVKIAGNAGMSGGLSALTIAAAGDVAIGGSSRNGTPLTGLVTADKGVDITGKKITVGDRITAKGAGALVLGSGDVTVHGITAAGKVKVYGGEGKTVTLAAQTATGNDGSLKSSSTANDAVIINAAGGKFVNRTTGTKAIETAGGWKVYSVSPEADVFGTNLDSGTNAQWGSTISTYSASQNKGNKYIFIVQPTINVAAGSSQKIYGETMTGADIKGNAKATFVGADGHTHDVNDYANAFQEGPFSAYYSGTAAFTSEGFKKTATRTGGIGIAGDGKRAVYIVNADSSKLSLTEKGKMSGYKAATAEDGMVEILRRAITASSDGIQTYGSPDIATSSIFVKPSGTQNVTDEGLVNGDRLTVKGKAVNDDSTYAANRAGRTTADVGTYENALNLTGYAITKDGADASANYTVTTKAGALTVTPATLKVDMATIDVQYGDVDYLKEKLANAVGVSGYTNGDNGGKSYAVLAGTSKALRGENETNDVIRLADGHFGKYAIDHPLLANPNYKVEVESEGGVTIGPALLWVATHDITAQYGDVEAVKNGLKGNVTLGLSDGGLGLTNGDQYKYASVYDAAGTDALLENGTKTADVNEEGYAIHLGNLDFLKNNYDFEKAPGKTYITPREIKEGDLSKYFTGVGYTTKYGEAAAFGTAVFHDINGTADRETIIDITDSGALRKDGTDRITWDAGDNIYSTTVSLDKLDAATRKNYSLDKSLLTFANTASVTKADLTVATGEVNTTYGTVKEAASTLTGLTNGDSLADISFDYGNYGGAYVEAEGEKRTTGVGTYDFHTKLGGADFLKNYNITGGDAKANVDYKLISFNVTGQGSSTADVTYTVAPSLEDQYAYGEGTLAAYTPAFSVGEQLTDNTYKVGVAIGGQEVKSGDPLGNYRYLFDGNGSTSLVTITPPEVPGDTPNADTPPDRFPSNPSNVNGTGSITDNRSATGIAGVDRVLGLADAQLPFFKVLNHQIFAYGTYEVSADPDKVQLSPVAKVLPEPNQPKTQYREYTREFTTSGGSGEFKLTYDGSRFSITPMDAAARVAVYAGDPTRNVELTSQALHAAFSEMGITLEGLDSVYVDFG